MAGGTLTQLQQAVGAIPDPKTLIKPLTDTFDKIKSLSTEGLSTELLSSVKGLESIGSLVPADGRDLVAGVSDRIASLKTEFISGDFGQLSQWSDSVKTLHDELKPLLSGGSGTLEDRLIEFLRDKITELVQLILPSINPGLSITGPLTSAISTDRLSALNTVKAELISSMAAAKAEFDAGNFSNTAAFDKAQAAFQQLVDLIAVITSGPRRVLDQAGATVDGITALMKEQFDNFQQIEMVDLGNIKDKFSGAIKKVEDAVKGLDLGSVKQKVEDVFSKINDVIGKFDLSQLTKKLDGLQGELKSILDALDGALLAAVASIRSAFTKIKDALKSVASSLGTYDADGVFHFKVEDEISSFLNSIKQTLQETIQPLLNDFKTTISQTLQQVHDGLVTVKGEIEKVKDQLQEMLQGVNDQIQSLDVPGTLESARQTLDQMLKELGDFDFEPVVVPVISEIDEISGELKKIDVSSLNDFTKGALKVSVSVVTAVDFEGQITAVLMEEFDKLLAFPKQGLNEIETSVEGLIKRFSDFAPGALLAPLDEVFAPVTNFLNELNLESLVKPLDEWYARLLAELDKISPAALLQPVVDLYGKLTATLDAVSPEQLVRPLSEAIDGIKAEIKKIDVTGLAGDLGGVLTQVKDSLEKISPESLLAPVVDAFDKIMAALDGFDPSVLLKPVADIFDALVAPLANLTGEHARLISEAFALLRGIVDTFDPKNVFKLVREQTASVNNVAKQIDVGALLAALKGPYDAMQASFTTHGGGANVSFAASVESLNPLKNPTISQAAADIQQIQAKLNALAQAQPPTDLVTRYDSDIRAKIESFIPVWAKENISADSIRRAFQVLNPLNLTAEIKKLYDAIKDQLRNFDPRILQEQIKGTFEKAKSAILSLDPKAILAQVQGVIDDLLKRLDVIDLSVITGELKDIVDEVKNIAGGLNPERIIAQLQDLVDEVKSVVASIQPSQILRELSEPFELAKSIIAEFDPASFKEPLLAVFDGIQKVLAEIDVGVVLQPLNERLQQLHDELEDALKRTGTAFNGMLAAIPV
jgi:vacuolar-type H+-ATPase subunit E/Vma4